MSNFYNLNECIEYKYKSNDKNVVIKSLVDNTINSSKLTNDKVLDNKWYSFIYDYLIDTYYNKPFRDTNICKKEYIEEDNITKVARRDELRVYENSKEYSIYWRDGFNAPTNSGINGFNLTGFFTDFLIYQKSNNNNVKDKMMGDFYDYLYSNVYEDYKNLFNQYSYEECDFIFSNMVNNNYIINFNYNTPYNIDLSKKENEHIKILILKFLYADNYNHDYLHLTLEDLILYHKIFCCVSLRLAGIELTEEVFNTHIKTNIIVTDSVSSTLIKYYYYYDQQSYNGNLKKHSNYYWMLYTNNFNNYLNNIRLSIIKNCNTYVLDKREINATNYLNKLYFLVNSNYQLKTLKDIIFTSLEEKTQLLGNIQSSTVTSSSSTQSSGTGAVTNTASGNTSNSGSSSANSGKTKSQTFNTGVTSTTTENENKTENIDMSLNSADETPSTIQKTSSVNTVTQRQGDGNGLNEPISSTTHEVLEPATTSDTSLSTSSSSGETNSQSASTGTATSTITNTDRIDFYEYFEKNNILNILDAIKKRLYDSELFYN